MIWAVLGPDDIGRAPAQGLEVGCALSLRLAASPTVQALLLFFPSSLGGAELPWLAALLWPQGPTADLLLSDCHAWT